MYDPTKDDQKDGITLNEQELQGLETILKRSIAFEQFQGSGKELQRTSQTKDFRRNQRCLSEIEAEAKVWLDTVDWAEAAGRLDPSCRFLLRLFPIERVHEERWLGGLYESDLGDIKARIEAIREREGLDDDEYWPNGEGPKDWEELEQQYSSVLDRKFEETLREYGQDDVADLYHVDRQAYDIRREQGRRLVFEEISEEEQIHTVQKRLESEADVCANGGAYYAATVMMGSAMEAALLSACLKHLDKALSVRDRLPKSERPNGKNPKCWRLLELTPIANEAGWLPDFIVGDRSVSSRTHVDSLRGLRNLVHPSRHLTDEINRDMESEYANARATFNLLKRHLAESGDEFP